MRGGAVSPGRGTARRGAGGPARGGTLRGAGAPGGRNGVWHPRRTTGDLGGSVRQGGIVSPFPSAHERLTQGAINRSANDWEQRYRRTVIISDTSATAFVVAGIGNFFGARDAAN